MALPLPEGLSEDQLVAIQDIFRLVEIRGRDQMNALLYRSFEAIAMLEWAWEFHRENDNHQKIIKD
jgi:hypothetical protein